MGTDIKMQLQLTINAIISPPHKKQDSDHMRGVLFNKKTHCKCKVTHGTLSVHRIPLENTYFTRSAQ